MLRLIRFLAITIALVAIEVSYIVRESAVTVWTGYRHEVDHNGKVVRRV